MARELRNIGASVRARLLDLSRRVGADFQNLLTRYALERLLYRLSVSAERDRFVLKGAMLFAAWLDDPFRPTGDLDLLGFGDDEVEHIANIIQMEEFSPMIWDRVKQSNGNNLEGAGIIRR